MLLIVKAAATPAAAPATGIAALAISSEDFLDFLDFLRISSGRVSIL